MSGLVNKVKDAVSSHKHTENEPTTHSHTTSTTGTHGTTVGRTEGLGTTGTTGTHGTTVGRTEGLGTTGTTGTTGGYTEGTFAGHNEGPASCTDGPHNSNMMNKADPRVDSDRDYSRNMGLNSARDATADNKTIDPTANRGGLGASTVGTTGMTTGHHTTAGHPTTTGRTGNLTSGTTGYTENVPVGTFGPHGGRAANAMDPRVDSDLDNTRTHNTRSTGTTGGLTSTHGTTTGTTGTTGHYTTTTGTTGTTGGLTGAYDSSGPGPAPNTAGPHKSDMMNKADPRVDSDLDGSKTYGGNKTYNTTSSSYAEKDPTDAAQVPPSVLQKHVGAPEMAHDDHTHQREKRHSISHQANHKGL